MAGGWRSRPDYQGGNLTLPILAIQANLLIYATSFILTMPILILNTTILTRI